MSMIFSHQFFWRLRRNKNSTISHTFLEFTTIKIFNNLQNPKIIHLFPLTLNTQQLKGVQYHSKVWTHLLIQWCFFIFN